MKRKTLSLLLAVTLALGLSACNSFAEPSSYYDLPDGYHAGTDYSMNFQGGFLPTMTAAEEGYYFVAGEFLFYWEPGLEEAAYVCNRPECDHWDDRCSAHFTFSTDGMVQYYEGKLYITVDEHDEQSGYSCWLYEVDPQDCTRKQLCKLPYGTDDMAISMMHRGYLYLFSHDAVTQSVYLERVALNELEEKSLTPTVLLEEESVSVLPPYVYGEHMYVCVTKRESGLRHFYYWYDVDLETGEIKEMDTPEAEDGSYFQIFSAYENKVILTNISPDRYTAGDYTTFYYTYDCTTGEVEPLVTFPGTEEPAYEFLYWDGANTLTFFYDQLASNEYDIRVSQRMQILDESFEPVKTLPIDIHIDGYMIGDEDHAFFGSDNVLYAVDKNSETLSYVKIFDKKGSELYTDSYFPD